MFSRHQKNTGVFAKGAQLSTLPAGKYRVGFGLKPMSKVIRLVTKRPALGLSFALFAGGGFGGSFGVQQGHGFGNTGRPGFRPLGFFDPLHIFPAMGGGTFGKEGSQTRLREGVLNIRWQI